MDQIVITLTVKLDMSMMVDHPAELAPEVVCQFLDRASNFYKMQMTARMVADTLRKEREMARMQSMLRES